MVGGTSYALTLASGYVYLKLLANIFLSGNDPTRMDVDSFKRAASDVVANENMKTVIADAKSSYTPPKK